MMEKDMEDMPRKDESEEVDDEPKKKSTHEGEKSAEEKDEWDDPEEMAY